MIHKCDHCDYESNRMYNIRRHVKNKHESHHPNNENKVDNDVSPERLPSSPTKINHGLNEPSSSANFSLTPQVNDMMEGKNTPLESADPKEVSNEEDDVYAEHREFVFFKRLETIEFKVQKLLGSKKNFKSNEILGEHKNFRSKSVLGHKYL